MSIMSVLSAWTPFANGEDVNGENVQLLQNIIYYFLLVFVVFLCCVSGNGLMTAFDVGLPKFDLCNSDYSFFRLLFSLYLSIFLTYYAYFTPFIYFTLFVM